MLLHTRPTACKPKSQVSQAAAICINLELLVMGIIVPETCLANNKFYNKKPICCVYLAVYFHVSMTMHGQTHINSQYILSRKYVNLIYFNITYQIFCR